MSIRMLKSWCRNLRLRRLSQKNHTNLEEWICTKLNFCSWLDARMVTPLHNKEEVCFITRRLISLFHYLYYTRLFCKGYSKYGSLSFSKYYFNFFLKIQFWLFSKWSTILFFFYFFLYGLILCHKACIHMFKESFSTTGHCL